ncbi:MAG: helix-turn-helix transcriptional regulator [Clostridia bacterium]|nr:helix-turn-helix transcriptional regulator [Clostridia bacterium]
MLVNQLKSIRTNKSTYTQEQLAEIVDCTRQTIIALEQNKYNPSLVLALRIARALNVSVEDIFFLND